MKFLSLTSVGFQLLLADPVLSTGLRLQLSIDSGPIFGTSANFPDGLSTVNKYLGIPFAGPVRRFAPPARPNRWQMPLNATSYGPACIQSFTTSEVATNPQLIQDLFNSPPLEEGEVNCLNLNVFAPASPAPAGGRAVMAIIPGGGFQLGGAASYDGTAFAAYEDIVVVSMNYRTNVFGFPGDPSIPVRERNLGLLDQRLALDWIQRNVATFGGDPAKVTAWGASAGAMSVDAHITAFGGKTKPPFRAGIMQAGQMSKGHLALRGNNSEAWESLLRVANCTDPKRSLECMRNIPAATLKGLQEQYSIVFMPVIDNVTVVDTPAKARAKGDFVKVPVLAGNMAQEGRLLVNDKINLTLFLDVYLPPTLASPELREVIVATYRAQPELKTDFDVAAAIYTELLWQCPQGMVTNDTAAAGVPAWRYIFNATVPSFLPTEYAWLGAFHGLDSMLLLTDPQLAPYTSQTYALAVGLRRHWAGFVRNPAAGPGWPKVGKAMVGDGKIEDVGFWGDIGTVKTGAVTPLSSNVTDVRCPMFKPIYDVLSQITG